MTDIEYPEEATPIDPDEAEDLLFTHITTRSELDRWEQENIVEALAWVDQTKPKYNRILIQYFFHHTFYI